MKAILAACVISITLLTVITRAQPSRAQTSDPAASLFAKTLEQARGGDVNAQNILGALYLAGTGTARSEAEAFNWFKRAAEQGHAAAQANLGTLYIEGIGVAKDLNRGAELFRLSAAQDLPLGIAKLGAARP